MGFQGINKVNIFLSMKDSNTIKNKSLLIFITLLIALLSSCKTTQQSVDSKDLSYLYNPTKNPFNPRYNIINQTDESSTLSVKFIASDLFFSEANPQGIPTARLMLTVKLFNISLGNMLSDTAVVNLDIVQVKGVPEYTFSIPLKVKTDAEYITEIRILDKLRMKVVQAFVPFNTLSYFNRYNFSIRGHFEKNVLFNPVIRVNEYVNLLYLRGSVDSLYITYFKPFREVPDPPSILLPEKVLDYDPEQIVAVAYSDTMPIMFPREGIYLCSVDREVNEGYTFLNFGEAYPAMTTPEVMIEPLAYLATENELDRLRTAQKPKVALDDFWIECGGNVEKARELIRIYYTRVLYSNFYFSSYKEGWRTERGMIYIIYGPPDKVYKTAEGESWGYKNPSIKSSWGGRYTVNEDYLFFNFKKRDNKYSDNDYFLSRSETLVSNWDKAISSWKKGIVFRLDNPDDF